MTGKTLLVNVEPTDTTERIKELVEEIDGIPPDQMILFVRNDFMQEMEDGLTAQDYNIKEGAVVTLRLKLRGD